MTGDVQSQGLPVAAEPAPAPEEAEARLAEIATYRRTNRAKYFADEKVLEEERRLLEQRERASAEALGRPSSERQPGDMVPLMPAAEWAREAGPDADRETYRRTVIAANDVLRFAGEDASRLETSFEALPETVRGVAACELANRSSVPIEPLSRSDMEAILRDPVNAQLARQWGGQAAERFATVQARLWRAVERLSLTDTESLARWLFGLPPRARAAIYRRLGEGGM